MPRRLDTAGDAVRQVIRAYHGSPYDFDRFDASKIGTGEGAQSYGHGLYFAGNEGVSRTYRDDLSRNSFLIEGARTPWTEATMDDLGVRPRARVTLRMAIRDGRDPIDRLQQAQSGHGPLSAPWNEYQDAIDLLRGAVGKLGPNKGRLYEVEIGYPEHALLDWDKPMGGAIAGQLTPALRSGLERGVRERLDMGQLERHAGNLRGMLDEPALAPGQVLHEGLLADLGAVGASKKLLDAGIPGIRYLDQGSRAAGEGTRNYVMFPGTEDSIRILRKYAVPGMVGTGAAAMSGGTEE